MKIITCLYWFQNSKCHRECNAQLCQFWLPSNSLTKDINKWEMYIYIGFRLKLIYLDKNYHTRNSKSHIKF